MVGNRVANADFRKAMGAGPHTMKWCAAVGCHRHTLRVGSARARSAVNPPRAAVAVARVSRLVVHLRNEGVANW